mgnify:CR=1 FL=1
MDKVLHKADIFRRLAEQTVQPLRTSDGYIDYSSDSLLNAYNNILVLTELNSLLKQTTDEQYEREADESLAKLEALREKLKFPKY